MEEEKKEEITPNTENKEEEKLQPLSLSEWAEAIRSKMFSKSKEVV